MILLFISFLAGILTVLAPCVLPLLPVIIGSSVVEGQNKHKATTIILSLITSIVLFTLLLKWSSAFIGIPQGVWTGISGGILIAFSLTMIFPALWEKLPFTAKLSASSNAMLGKGYQRKGFWGDVIMGAALGPVFSACSPTYFIILATVLPANFAKGLLYLVVFAVGLGLGLMLISILGQKIVAKLGKVSDPKGWFKRIIGILILIVGIAVVSGYDKVVEAKLLSGGFFDVTKIETKLLQKTDPNAAEVTPTDPLPTDEPATQTEGQSLIQKILNSSKPSTPATYMTLEQKAAKYKKYTEIAKPSGFVNTDGLPVTIGQYIGKKVVLIDFLTYSCINCQRTFPYLNSWYSTYETKGFVIIGIHTPEFAFEKNIDNVKSALAKEGITFPVVLDNDYGTWSAYANQYWPRKYLIDIDGYVVYDHIGEGEYDTTEKKIVDLLNERAQKLGEPAVALGGGTVSEDNMNFAPGQSPETYIGSGRGTIPPTTDGGMCSIGVCEFQKPNTISKDKVAFDGSWNITGEYAELVGNSGSISYRFNAHKVYIVADTKAAVNGTVYIDGKLITPAQAGDDVGADGVIHFNGAKLYNLVDLGKDASEHIIEIRLNSKGLEAYTFTFG